MIPPSARSTPAPIPGAVAARTAPLPAFALLLLLASSIAFAAPAPATSLAVVHVFDACDLRTPDVRQPEGTRRVWETLYSLAALQSLPGAADAKVTII